MGAITDAIGALQQASMKLGEQMYREQQQAEEPGDAQSSASPDADGADVVDADFEEVDERDRNSSN